MCVVLTGASRVSGHWWFASVNALLGTRVPGAAFSWVTIFNHLAEAIFAAQDSCFQENNPT